MFIDILFLSLFTKDVRGNVSTTWWNSEKNDAAHINFLNSTADNWFHERLKTFMATYDIDNFKFDGGEIDLMPWVCNVYICHP